MNAKYASKPNFNPNEPNLFGFARWVPCPRLRGHVFFGWHLQAQLVGGHSERSEESRIFCWKPEAGCWKLFYKNEPNFFTTKYALSNQKRRNGGQKPTQKNETNPFVDNFRCSTAALGCVSAVISCNSRENFVLYFQHSSLRRPCLSA